MMDNNNSLGDEFVISPSNNAYCSNNGLFYMKKSAPLNLSQTLCRCQPSYYGETCDLKDESHLIRVAYGLSGLSGFLLLFILAVICQAYKKSRNLCNMKYQTFERLRKETLAYNKLKFKLKFPASSETSLSSGSSFASHKPIIIQQNLIQQHFSVNMDVNQMSNISSNKNVLGYQCYPIKTICGYKPGEIKRRQSCDEIGHYNAAVITDEKGYVTDTKKSTSAPDLEHRHRRSYKSVSSESNLLIKVLTSSARSLSKSSSNVLLEQNIKLQN